MGVSENLNTIMHYHAHALQEDMLTQVMRYHTGSTVRPKKSCQDLAYSDSCYVASHAASRATSPPKTCCLGFLLLQVVLQGKTCGLRFKMKQQMKQHFYMCFSRAASLAA